MKSVLIFLLSASSILTLPQSSRIVGGQPANAGKYPYAAAVYKSTPDGNYFCVGSLLTAQWVLTAGQCVDGATMFTVILGTHILNGNDNNSVKLSTDEYVLHPDYNPLTLENDIGLIKFRFPVVLTTYIRALFLPFGAMYEGSSGLAIGWGQTSDADSTISDTLNWVALVNVPNSECKLTYGDQITDNMACFIGNYNEGPCLGDSGSPIVHEFSRIDALVVAISSFHSSNGCETLEPSGYTRIFPYNDWIGNITQDDSLVFVDQPVHVNTIQEL